MRMPTVQTRVGAGGGRRTAEATPDGRLEPPLRRLRHQPPENGGAATRLIRPMNPKPERFRRGNALYRPETTT